MHTYSKGIVINVSGFTLLDGLSVLGAWESSLNLGLLVVMRELESEEVGQSGFAHLVGAHNVFPNSFSVHLFIVY